MTRLLLSWLLVAVSIAGCITYQNKTKITPPPDPFEMVCEALEADCSDVEEPVIVYTRLTQFLGVLGGHIGGETYIFVDPDGPHMWKTVLHETVHYVAWQTGITRERCESEEMARVVASRLTNTEVRPGWAENYGCER